MKKNKLALLLPATMLAIALAGCQDKSTQDSINSVEDTVLNTASEGLNDASEFFHGTSSEALTTASEALHDGKTYASEAIESVKEETSNALHTAKTDLQATPENLQSKPTDLDETTMKAMIEQGKINLNINFPTGSSHIPGSEAKTINNIVALMKNNPELKLAIEGHTDNTGSAATNKALSLARAKAVVAAVVAKGIAPDRLRAEGYGDEQPVSTNDTPENRAKNRRVVLVKF